MVYLFYTTFFSKYLSRYDISRHLSSIYIKVRALIVMLNVIKNDATLSTVRFDYFPFFFTKIKSL